MSCIVVEITGQKFGQLTVIEQAGRDKWGQVLWKCMCDCGNHSIVQSGKLRSKSQISCGCLKKTRLADLTRTHGKSQTKEYRSEQDHLKRFRKYGLSLDEYNKLKESQNFRCAICGVIPDGNSSRADDGFNIDHSHVTGRVRGLLCLNCNAGIGMLKDSETVLQLAINYLRKAS